MRTSLQLCAQAMCLEEMLCCDNPMRRALLRRNRAGGKEVEFTPELREEVRTMLAQMHELYRRGSTPKVKSTKACNACSLKEICLPALMRQKDRSQTISVGR